MNSLRYKQITVRDEALSFEQNGEPLTFQRARLPKEFLDWVIEGRHAMYDLLEGNKPKATFFSSHLPVMVTYSRNNPIPFNTSNKGVGLLPLPHRLDGYCEQYQQTFENVAHEPWEKNLSRRLECVRNFTGSADVSDEALVTLEIFEQQSFANLCDYPVATLHYAGDGPVYRSFQINAVVQIAEPEHPVYNFAYLSRQLFEYDDFHITQTQFPYAYIFYPVEVRDKTPFPRRIGLGDQPKPREWAEMTMIWDKDVLEQLIRAPSVIQKFIVKVTEEYARTHGHVEVNLPMFNAVRTRYMKPQ